MSKILGSCLAVSLIGNILLVINGSDEVVNVTTPEPVKAVEKKAVVEDAVTDDQEWKLMKTKIVSLTESLAVKNEMLDKLQAQLKEQQGQASARLGRGGSSFAERMKKLAEENPEAYKQMQERMAAMRERMRKGTVSRAEFFKGLNTDSLNEKQQAALKGLQDKMARIDEINAKMADAPPEEQAELQREVFMEMRGTREMMTTARDAALDSLASEIGYEGDAADQFTDYIDYIYDMTNLRSLFRGRGGRGSH